MLSKNSVYLLQKRYCRPGETPEGVFKRVAELLASGDRKFEEKLFDAMTMGIFLPNSPCLFNAGTPGGNLHACYTLKVEDSLDSIFNSVVNMAKIFKSGGGVGLNYSPLRERGAELSGGGTSSGVLSFMGLFDRTVETVKQGGKRRGALIGILNYSHPEIFDFIKVKLEGRLQNFNLSILVDDSFMKMINTDKKIDIVSPKGYKVEKVRASDIFEVATFTAWCNGDPGLLFFDRINKDNPFYPEIKIDTCNPCFTGDTLVAVADGRNAVPFSRLTQEDKDVPVYCKSEFGSTTIRMMRNIKRTGTKKEVVKVTFDDGSFVKCTPDHPFLQKLGSESLAYRYIKDGRLNVLNYKKAEIEDSIERFDSIISAEGRRLIHRKVGFAPQYIMIYNHYTNGGKTKGIHVHHKDYNVANDGFENLRGCTPEEHSIFHDIRGGKNPLRKLKEMGKFEEYKLRNPWYNKYGEDNPSFGRPCSELCKSRTSEANSGKTPWNKDLTKETDERLFKQGQSLKKQHSKEWNEKVGLGLKRFYEERKASNHKVVSVEFCGYEDVYDGTVDEFSNFGIITSFQDPKFMESSGVFVHNCAEVAMPHYSACCLGSINISKFVWKNEFNFDRFEETCKLGMRVLSTMNKVSVYPMPEITEAMEKYNPVGLGIMGFADCLIKLGIRYDSKECLDFIDQLGEVYKRVTEEYNKDKFYFYRRIIAPTGSLSILADCSSGIEPIFDTAFEKRLTVGVIEETKDLYKSEFARTAHQVSPDWHVKVLSQWQKWVNGGVSKTINLPHDASVNDIKNVYKMAWETGCKGVTVYRDRCRGDDGQVLVAKSVCADEACQL